MENSEKKDGRNAESKSALEKLNRPGWEELYTAMIELKRRCEQDKMKNELAGTHRDLKLPVFILSGDPGTGKTMAGMLIGEVLKEIGCLKNGHTISWPLYSASVSTQSGHLMKSIEQAEEGVLFIDEAWRLIPGSADSDKTFPGSEKIQVISTITNTLLNPAHHLCVVLALYPDKLEELLEIDPGLTARFLKPMHLTKPVSRRDETEKK